eukprot:SAG11_NODE_28147_length_325_cov_0.606195_1_plen_37_part_10
MHVRFHPVALLSVDTKFQCAASDKSERRTDLAKWTTL